MKREFELERRLHALSLLREAMSAMKILSAHHFREARSAVEPARSYRQEVARILRWTGATLAAGPGPAGLLVIGGELGLCGGYHARLVAAGLKRRKELGPGPTICVGHRLGTLLCRRGVEVQKIYAAPMSVRGIPALLLRLAEDILTTYVKEQLSSLDIVSSIFFGVGADEPQSERVLPFVSAPAEPMPAVRYVSHERLARAVLQESLYITIYGLLLDALASEYSARMVATQTAEKWLRERAERLRRHLASAHRERSTQEIIEIAAGARSVRRGGARGRGAAKRWPSGAVFR